MNAPVIPADLEPDPIEIDPRPCELCGCTIDRHHREDTGEGPEFFCIDFAPDELTLEELEQRAEFRRQEEVAAIMARLEAMDDPSKRPPAADPASYRVVARDRVASAAELQRMIDGFSRARRGTPQSTIEAFLYVARNYDADYVAKWLANHPHDVETLTKLWEAKNGLS